MIKAEVPYKFLVQLTLCPDGTKEISVQGSRKLLSLVQDLKSEYGLDPKQWPLQSEKNSENFLVNEFILKAKGEFKLSYEHEELCHCRSVTTEKVFYHIKDGCLTISDVSRATMAGTSCGTCHSDIQGMINQVLQK